MKRFLIVAAVLGLLMSSCLPAALQPAAVTPAPVDLNATAAILVEQTLQAMPSQTAVPSNTPVIMTETAMTHAVETTTIDETSISQTAALNTGTSIHGGTNPALEPTGSEGLPPSTVQSTVTFTAVSPFSPTPSETLHPRFYGTLPPSLPFGNIDLFNKSKVEVYISLQVNTTGGFTTILEYPVPRKVSTNAPAGKYTYVAWVGGKKIIGKFSLGQGTNAALSIYKDRIEIKLN